MKLTQWLCTTLLMISTLTIAHAETGTSHNLPSYSQSDSHQIAPQMRPNFVPMCRGAYYDWGKSQGGWGYCYQWACNGGVLNQGSPVDNALCESNRHSYYSWGRSQAGDTYCYQWTPYGVAMNEGSPVDNSFCE